MGEEVQRPRLVKVSVLSHHDLHSTLKCSRDLQGDDMGNLDRRESGLSCQTRHLIDSKRKGMLSQTSYTRSTLVRMSNRGLPSLVEICLQTYMDILKWNQDVLARTYFEMPHLDLTVAMDRWQSIQKDALWNRHQGVWSQTWSPKLMFKLTSFHV